MAASLPAITGQQLVRLFELDGWEPKRRTREGIFFFKRGADGRTRTTLITTKKTPLATGTLAHILGPLQSGVGRQGLEAMIERHGLK